MTIIADTRLNRPLLEARGITKTIQTGAGELKILKGVDMDLRPGELTLLMGPSGSGKTTLLSILGCILTASAGNLKVAGEEAVGRTSEGLADVRRRHIGFVFQSYNLFPTLTAHENVLVALDVRRAKLGDPAAGRHPRRSPKSASPTASTPIPPSFRAAKSSAWPSPARWPATLRWCWPTSRRRLLTARMARRSWSCWPRLPRIPTAPCWPLPTITARLGYADRIIRIEDGRIVADERPGNKIDAVFGCSLNCEERRTRDMLKNIAIALLLALVAGGGYILYDKKSGGSTATTCFGRGSRQHRQLGRSGSRPRRAQVRRNPPRHHAARPRRGSPRQGRRQGRGRRTPDPPRRPGSARQPDVCRGRGRGGPRKTQAAIFASGRVDIRNAEDDIYAAERAITGARIELDYAIAAKRSGNGQDQAVVDARKRLKDAKDRLERERLAFIKAQSKSNIPAPSPAESRVSKARTGVRMAEALLDKTRIRAPSSGTLLQLNAKDGEIVAPSVEAPLVVMGDMSVVRVKAEVDEGDVAKIKVGQKAFVRSISYPGRDFEGRVSRLAPSLTGPKVGPRGPRRATDVEVMEVTIDLEGAVPLLPGMRVDAFFR